MHQNRFPDRLKVCKLTTLHYRQLTGDMIEVYKIVSGRYDSAITPTLIISDTHKTRGNDLRLQKSCLKGTLYSVEKNPYTEGLLCLLLHSEGTAIFMSINSVVDFSLNFK